MGTAIKGARRLFPRIMAVVLAVIVLLTVAFGAMALFAVRQERINARLTALTEDARELARLSVESRGATYYTTGRLTPYGTGWQGTLTAADAAFRFLNRKVSEVYGKYGAYIAVANRMGSEWVRVSTNLTVAEEEDPDFAASLDSAELSSALDRVLQGEEIAVRVMVRGRAIFTVGVPYMQGGEVVGAALIQTPAQRIEGDIWEIALPLALTAIGAAVLAGAALSFLLRRQLRPLTQLRAAADTMAEGDFSVRVQTRSETPEITALSSAFNTMAGKLGAVEEGRREFVANVSHELRSPITSISGFVQGMEDGTIPPEDHARYLSLVSAETRRMSKLVSDLLTLSRLEREDAALQRRSFDLCEMIRRSVIRKMADLERGGIEVETDFGSDPCMVWADPDRIEEVLVNLVDNAVKFTPSCGKITLKTEAAGGSVRVTVADNGPGIPPEDREKIFERFFTADRAHTSGKGTGLGLPICRRILALHGEKLWLDSSREGAVFCFTLPATTEK